MPSSLGPAEILVILVVALIVLGPKRLPEAGRQVGKALTEVRRWSRDIQGEMRGAFDSSVSTPPRAELPSSSPTTLPSEGGEGVSHSADDDAPQLRGDEPA